MRAFPKLTEEQLKDALGERFNPDSTYECVHTREQKQAQRKGWHFTGATVDLGNTGERALYLVPGVAGPRDSESAPAAGGPSESSEPTPTPTPAPKKKKVVVKKKAKTTLKKFIAEKEKRDGGSSGSGEE